MKYLSILRDRCKLNLGEHEQGKNARENGVYTLVHEYVECIFNTIRAVQIQFATVPLTIALSCCAGTAMANYGTLVNQTYAPMVSVVYKIAHKNPGHSVVFSAPQTTHVTKNTLINFALNSYKLAGIVPVSVNGTKIPSSVTTFDSPTTCSLATDTKHPTGTLILSLKSGKPICTVKGGIFN